VGIDCLYILSLIGLSGTIEATIRSVSLRVAVY